VNADDPLAGSSWSRAETVAGFVASPPNATLMEVARRELARLGGRGRLLDIGCGAGRNAVPLASAGWDVVGLDLSRPMVDAAVSRAEQAGVQQTVRFALAPMDALPIREHGCDLLVAHGIWNLAPSSATFRRAVRDAARVASANAALFVFTFSRTTLPPEAAPVEGEAFVFTQFSGRPQCFLTREQLLSELAAEGFVLDAAYGLRELNLPPPNALRVGGPPVIYEGVFRFTG
jgi:SAM-dependent methyltransferase